MHAAQQSAWLATVVPSGKALLLVGSVASVPANVAPHLREPVVDHQSFASRQ